MPCRRFLFSLLLSLLLHLAVFAAADPRTRGRPRPPPATPAMLDVRLAPADNDRLLKNTLSDDIPPTPASPLPPKPGKGMTVASARKKLAEHLYYPPEAVARGIEGEVRLLLSLDDSGQIVDAQVASGSGHAILDQAALRAAHAMGRLADIRRRELILPVVFRLAP